MHNYLNPKYLALREFITAIPSRFADPKFGLMLHNGRNIIKSVEVNGIQLVIKSYQCPSLLNRFIYGRLRRSKAQRAYLHATRLRNLGIDSPEAVASIDIRNRGVLANSYFISLHSNYQSMDVVNDYPHNATTLEPLMDAMTDFIITIHNAGILHRDLNITNILYRHNANGNYSFQLIDTNRMDFKRRLSDRERIDNMRRLSCSTAAYIYILERYAQQMNLSDNSFELKGVLARLIFDERQRAKQRVKRHIRHHNR